VSAFSFFVLHILVEFEFDQDIFVQSVGASFFEFNVVAVEMLNDELPDGRLGIRLAKRSEQFFRNGK
jgi:hypothetical protein